MEEVEHLEISSPTHPFSYYIPLLTPKSTISLTSIKIPIFLYGFPNDEGTYNSGERVGSEKGPFSFRKGLKEFPFVPFVKINNLSLFDAGNAPNDLINQQGLWESHQEAQSKIKELLLLSKKGIVFMIGGSNDMSYSSCGGLMKAFPIEKVGIININAHLNMSKQDKNKIFSKSTCRMILEEPNFQSSESILYHFGVQGAQNTRLDLNYLEEKKENNVYWLDKDIRRYPFNQNNPNINTQAGQLFEVILNELSQKVDHIMLSFDLDSINSAYCPGVSIPSVIGGLSEVESLEIMGIVGRNQKVRLVELLEYNPAVEDNRTRKLAVYMFYSFCKGVSEREITI